MQRAGIVLLHGHGRTGRSMASLGSSLRRAGYATIAPSYGWRRRSVTEAADWLLPRVAAFAAGLDGPLHIVTHSLGGLVARALLNAWRPDRLGRVVMLAPPNAGSGLADLLFRIRCDRLVLGPVGGHLRTARTPEDERLLGTVDYELGIVAGNRPLDPIFSRLVFKEPSDGKVSVSASRITGMSDHIVLPVSHTLMVYDRHVTAQVRAYLAAGRFDR